MNQWLNRSHPQTLQAGIILGYISAVFGLLDASLLLGGLFILVYLGLGVGAFASANNKRWGYITLAVCAVLAAGWRLLLLLLSVVGGYPGDLLPFLDLSNRLELILRSLNGIVFPTALAVAVLHRMSREYQKVWFE